VLYTRRVPALTASETRFSVLKVRDEEDGRSLLGQQLASQVGRGEGREPGGVSERARGEVRGGEDLAELLWRHIGQVAAPELVPRVVEFFGPGFLRGTTVFGLVELVNGLGIGVFDDGRAELGSFGLRDLFRAARAGGDGVAFRHVAYQELLAAEYLRSPLGRHATAAIAHPRLTEQVREFLYRRSQAAGVAGPGTGMANDCVVPAGVYPVGPSHHLMLRQIGRPVRVDRFPVTVGRYKRFLGAVSERGPGEWDHPAMPAGFTHQPWQDRLRVPSYYQDAAYEQYPAIAVNWWSAYAFARFESKRLPTSLEWEAAARGFAGRLFPWGDDVDLSVVNCADSWSDHPLITYEAWREELDRGRLRGALPGPVDAHPGNVSPFGVREMAGNVWEWTATVLEDLNEAVICGGSFDNPYRAVQASSKGTYRRRGASNAVGFRCAEDV